MISCGWFLLARSIILSAACSSVGLELRSEGKTKAWRVAGADSWLLELKIARALKLKIIKEAKTAPRIRSIFLGFLRFGSGLVPRSVSRSSLSSSKS